VRRPRVKVPARVRESNVLRALATLGEADAEAIGEACGMTADRARYYLGVLERQGRVTSERETHDQADARVAALPVRGFVRRNARRRFLYRLCITQEMAA
jgi:hypothetical protein